jgi:phytoene/squalene synthetase
MKRIEFIERETVRANRTLFAIHSWLPELRSRAQYNFVFCRVYLSVAILKEDQQANGAIRILHGPLEDQNIIKAS